MELSSRKLVIFILIILVIGVVGFQISSLIDKVKDSIGLTNKKAEETSNYYGEQIEFSNFVPTTYYSLNSKFNLGDKENDELREKLLKLEKNKCNPSKVYSSLDELDQEIQNKIKKIANHIGSTPENLFKVMRFETGGTFCPCEVNNGGSSAVGLIQFMPPTAADLGTTSEDLCNMDILTQLNYVERYFDMQRGKKNLNSIQNLYMAILCPAAIGKAETEILFTNDGSRNGLCDRKSSSSDAYIAYEQNKGLDKDKNGEITISEVMPKIS